MSESDIERAWERRRQRGRGGEAAAPDRSIPPERIIDDISGLPDERFFAIAVNRHMALARRGVRPFSLVLLEIDGLESFAPYLRDHAIRVLSRTLRKTLREADTACRIDEGTIAVILDDTTDTGAAWAAERVRGALFASPAGDILTISAGVACYPSHALEAEQLVAKARIALQRAQSNGHDRVEVAPAE